jgi:hypothetical protein
VPSNELETTRLRIREAHVQEARGRMLSTTKLPEGRLAWAVSRWLTHVDNSALQPIKLSELTYPWKGRNLMGPCFLASAVEELVV